MRVFSVVGIHILGETSRLDAEYWDPFLIANSKKIGDSETLKDFVDNNVEDINSLSTDVGFDYLEISGISDTECETIRICPANVPSRAKHVLRKGDVVVSKVRPKRNAVGLIHADGIIGSSGLAVLRPAGVPSEFIFAFCKTDYFRRCLERASTSGMYPSVTDEDVLRVSFSGGSERFRRHVTETVQASLDYRTESEKLYRQSINLLQPVLDAIGEESNKDRIFIKNFSELESASRLDADYFIPRYENTEEVSVKGLAGWEKLGNLVSFKSGVSVGEDAYVSAGVPFIRVSDLDPKGISKNKHISFQTYKRLKEYQPEVDEILLSKDAKPGIAHHLCEHVGMMVTATSILRLKNISSKVKSEFLALVLNSDFVRAQASQAVKGSVTKHWTLDQIKEVMIPMLIETEQKLIQRKMRKATKLYADANRLLIVAKTSIDKHIDFDETEALKYLNKRLSQIV